MLLHVQAERHVHSARSAHCTSSMCIRTLFSLCSLHTTLLICSLSQNSPVVLSVWLSVASWTGVRAPSSGVPGARGPAMSVAIQPGLDSSTRHVKGGSEAACHTAQCVLTVSVCACHQQQLTSMEASCTSRACSRVSAVTAALETP